jgi:hypothetical protein
MGTELEEGENGHIVQWVFQGSRTIEGAHFQHDDVSDILCNDHGLYERKNVDVKVACKPCEEHVRCLAWWLRKSQSYGWGMPQGKRCYHLVLYVVDGMVDTVCLSRGQ